MLCFRNFTVVKIFMKKRGVGRKRFSVQIVLSHSAESFRRGTLPCFRKFRLSKKFMPKRGEKNMTCDRKFVVSQYSKTS